MAIPLGLDILPGREGRKGDYPRFSIPAHCGRRGLIWGIAGSGEKSSSRAC
jgi:hypothetical protein